MRTHHLRTTEEHARFDFSRLPKVGRFALTLTGILLVLLTGRMETSANPAANDYRLGTQDRIRIRVFEWRPTKDEVFEWAALNAEYSVGSAGRISLPLIGEIAASGITVNELAKTIGLRLRTRMGLAEAPDIAVEITQYRPFYLAGHVEKPGEYPYRPGITVLQALALAGGPQRSNELGSMRIERELIQSHGDLQIYSQEFNALLARRARLEAESKGRDAIEFPSTLKQLPDDGGLVATLLQQELQIFRSRRETFDNQSDTLEQLLQYLAEEIKSIGAQLKAHDDQTDLLRKELDAVTSLVSKGISTQTRKMALQRAISQMEAERSRLQTTLSRVKQDQSRTNISLLELHNKRINDSVAELRDVQFRLEATARRSQTTESLMNETQRVAPFILANIQEQQKREPIFKIIRAGVNSTTPIIANESTKIEPGDTLKIEIPRVPLTVPNLFVAAPAPRLPELERQEIKLKSKATIPTRSNQSSINRQYIPSSASTD